jgi:hypothetical protein
MKAIAAMGMLMSLALASMAQVLIDEFSDGVLDPEGWSVVFPNTNTELYEADGVLTFVNQGIILTQQEFGPSVVIKGRLRFTGSDQDGFMIWFRTDGVLGGVWTVPMNALVLGIRSSDFDHPAEVDLKRRSVELGEWQIALVNTASRIEMNEWVEFVVEDDGSTVTVYVGDLVTPVIEEAVADDFGDMVVMMNRNRQGSDCVMELDWVEIRTAAAVHRLGIAPARYYRTPRLADVDYQLVARQSSLDTEWFPVGQVGHGIGGEVFGFARGSSPDWLPSHAWRISEMGDGASLAFDGIDDFLFRPHAEALNLDGGMTLEAWVKPAVGGYPGVVLAKALSSAIVCYALELDDAGRARYRVLDAGGTAFVELVSSSALPVDEWTHVAGTYNGSQATLLVNGAVDATMAATSAVRVNALAPVNLGGILGTVPFGGLVDEVRVWNTARSAEAIAATHQSPLTGAEPGLAAYWPMSEGADQIVADAGPGDWDLTLGESDGPDTSDPAWTEASFPTESTLEMIWDFGQPWHALSWDAGTGGAYQLESTADLTGGGWSVCAETTAEAGASIEFYPFPPEEGSAEFDSFGVYRLWGPALPLDLGLVAYYPLDGNADDTSGNGHHGAVIGSPAEVDGVHGTALSFSGSEYIRIPDHPDLFSGSFSTVLWIKTDAAGAIRGAISKGQAFSPEVFRVLLLDGGDVQFSFRANGDQSGSISTPYGAYLGNWTMITVVYASSATRMYINDQLVEEKPFTSGPLQSDRDVLIGAGAFDTDGETPVQRWLGEIDEVRIYNRALAEDEVRILYGQFAP